jgi:hypothetical protein
MRAWIASLFVLVSGCGRHAAMLEAGSPDAGSASPAPDAGSRPPSDDAGPGQTAADGGTSQSFGPWIRDGAVATGGPLSTFHSSQPGDLWLELRDEVGHLALHRRTAAGWQRFAEMNTSSLTSVWIRSPAEAWVLEQAGTLHVFTAAGETKMDLSHPGRWFSAMGNGLIAYVQAVDGGIPSASCASGLLIGFLEVTNAGFTDIPVPDACSPVGSIAGGAAATWGGQVLFRDGAGFRVDNKLFTCQGLGFCWGPLSGSGSDDLFLLLPDKHTSWNGAMHFDGVSWNPVHYPTGTKIANIWSRPFGPTWMLTSVDVYEHNEGGWQDRGLRPDVLIDLGEPGMGAIGSDGTDAFATGGWVEPYDGRMWVYRYSR